ncbi:nucleotidyltransferase family protein [Microbacterium sp.]|uniref:nucleotidyltransferase family protein n=1 Tax=Microbacterium sp. TaxID=51671 RepID=UPI003C1FD8D3
MPSESAPLPVAQLRLDEAIELCTAWMHEQARVSSIRLLVLKGRALSHQGLRERHASSDVDVLIEPSRFEDFLEIVKAAGWKEFLDTFPNELFTLHSVTLRQDGWPNSIDVHSHWPGFLKPPAEVFDVLWSRRQELAFAHHPSAVPDRMSNVLVLALHSLRGQAAQPRHDRELEGLLALTLTEQDRDDLRALAQSTGSVAPLREVLPALGVPVSVTPADLDSPEYREWHRKVAGRQGRVASWLIGLRRVPWSQKALLLRHGIWPTDHDLLAEHPEVRDRPWTKIWARMTRIWRGLGQLPRVIPALRRR